MGCQFIAGLPPPPRIKFAGTHLYTWVERGTVRVNCPAQEQNMSLAMGRTRTTRSGVDCTNHEVPPTTVPKLNNALMGKWHLIKTNLSYCKFSTFPSMICSSEQCQVGLSLLAETALLNIERLGCM